MKQLVCEMCGGNDLIKDGGVFVCQNCGCKYTVEEAKKMMIEGTVEVSGTVKIDNTAQIQNYLELSQNAYEGGNGTSAFDYANKALEIQPQNSYAWIAKMKAIEYTGTFGNLQLTEVVEAGKNAVIFAPDEKKDVIKKEVYHYELTRALSLLKLATTKMQDTADVKATFERLVLISFLTASKNMLQADGKLVKIYDNVASEAVGMAKSVPDDDLSDDLELVKLVEECAKQYQFETDALIERYKIYGASLSDEAKNIRIILKRSLEEKAQKARETALEKEIKAKEARKTAYWTDNAELKKKLESEKQSLLQQVEISKEKIAALPETQVVKRIKNHIKELENEKDGLGMFKIKEKKAIQTKISEANNSLSEAQKQYDSATAPINKAISNFENRIVEIDEEFEKDR